MVVQHRDETFPPHRIQGSYPSPWDPLGTARGVAVLLLFLAGAYAAWAEDTGPLELGVYEFVSDFVTPMAVGRLEGVMASDGRRYRIAFYWVEPYVLRESDMFVRYADVIFMPGGIRCWVHGAPPSEVAFLAEDLNNPLPPRSRSAEAVLRSALAIVPLPREVPDVPGVSSGVSDFFQAARGRAEYTSESLPDGNANDLWSDDASLVQVLSALPSGRRYAKQQLGDGSLSWGVWRASTDQPLVFVTVKRSIKTDVAGCADPFDRATLGRWELIPDAYRAYWSFDQKCSELGALGDQHAAACRLCENIRSYLDGNTLPNRVGHGMSRLRFKAALVTREADLVWAAAREAVEDLCADDSVDQYQCLLELGSMSGKIDKQYPEGARAHLRPLVAQIVTRAGADIDRDLDRLMAAINRNSWFTYGELVLDEIRRQDLALSEAVDRLATRFNASRAAKMRVTFDPCEAIPSVRKYLARIDADPPPGTIDMKGVHDILEQGLAKRYSEGQVTAKEAVIQSVLRSLHMIVGDGPFCGDPNRLAESISRFSYLYLAVDKASEPIDTSLATLLALSFCDTSTPEDHERLYSQFREISSALQAQVETMLTERGLSKLVGVQDAEGVFIPCERVFRTYLDDPLWPAFKFPLTKAEQTRALNSLKLGVMELEPLFDEIALKFTYAGTSLASKEEILRGIALTAERTLSEAAFLRRPPYPGVSCQYRSQYGFTTVIRGPLYRENDRPRDMFKAMKYFHLGHRLEEVVARERELAEAARQAADTAQTP